MPKYQRKHNPPGPVETISAQSVNWPKLATQTLVGIRICVHLGGTRNLRDTMHVMEPSDASEVCGTRDIRHPEPRLLQPPRARTERLDELLLNLYKYQNLFRC